MKLVSRFLENIKPHFESGGKYEKYDVFYEAVASFCFSSTDVTGARVHVRDSVDTKRYMMIVVLSLLPCLFFGMYNVGFQAHRLVGSSLDFWSVFLTGARYVLPLVFVSYLVGGLWEFLFSVVRKHPINEGFLVTGLLFPLTLPPTLPLWQAALGITFGVVIGKEIFGGTGRNFLNPALTARAFVFFAYPASMTGDSVWTVVLASKDRFVDGFTGATALVGAKAAVFPQTAIMGANSTGATLWDLFVGFVPGSIGETSVIACLIGAVILLSTRVANFRTMFGCVLGLIGTSLVFSFFAARDTLPIFSLPFWYHLCLGGFMFGAIFMATDPVSSPSLNESKWIYGILIGFLVVVIRSANPAYPEGVMLSILLMNSFAPLIDHVMLLFRFKKRIPYEF